MRYATFIIVSIVLPALAAAGCGGKAPRRVVPDVRGQRLDVAEHHLSARHLDFEEVGGGTFGVVVRSNWWVCDQEPRPGKKARAVRLIVDRDCGGTYPATPTVPDVEGENLEEAEDRLDALGITYDVSTGDDEEPLVKHLWQVCSQDPYAGEVATHVHLEV